MSTLSLTNIKPNRVSEWWTRLYQTNRFLALSAAAYTLLFLATLVEV